MVRGHQMRMIASCLIIFTGCPSAEPDDAPKPQPVPQPQSSAKDAGSSLPSSTVDSGAVSSSPVDDAGPPSTPPMLDSGSTATPPVSDAGLEGDALGQDAGTMEEPIDAGDEGTPIVFDAGNDDTPIVIDAGASTAPEVADAGAVLETPVDAGVWFSDVLTTEEIYEGLSASCAQCHYYNSYFQNLDAFKSLLVDDLDFVVPGDPDNSQLYLLLINQGTATSNNGYTQMPPGQSFEDLSHSGNTSISVEQVYEWLLYIEDESFEGSLDAGTQLDNEDAGLPVAPQEDAGVIVAHGADIDINGSDVFLVTNEDDGYEVEADGLMTHAIEVTVMKSTASGFGNSNTVAPISGAKVKLTVSGTSVNVESCNTSSPGLTDATGKVICQVSAARTGTIYIDVFAQNNESQGWVGLYDNLEASFTACQNARTFFTREIMGPVFTKCTGCHNEYGIAREYNTWFGVLESEPVNGQGDDFITVNLDQIGNLSGPAGGVFYERYNGQEQVPYILAKPAGLMQPDLIEDMDKPYGHGGGKLIEPGSEDFYLMWELIDRINENKSCPTESEYLFNSPYEGAVEYSAAELYHRATFTLTGEYPSASEYKGLLEGQTFEEEDLVDAIGGLISSVASNNDPSDAYEQIPNLTTNPIMYRPAFYKRMGEALQDLLKLHKKGTQVGGLFSHLVNDSFGHDNTGRWLGFRHRYDNDIGITGSRATCMPLIDMPYKAKKCTLANNPHYPAYDTEEDCMLRFGCCEEIGNHDNLNQYIPPLDNGQGPKCGQYNSADEETCNAAPGCESRFQGTSFNELGFFVHPPGELEELIDWSDEGAELRLDYRSRDLDSIYYGYCFTGRVWRNNTYCTDTCPNAGDLCHNGKCYYVRDFCSMDSDLSDLDSRGFVEGTLYAADSQIVIPEGTPWMKKEPRRLINQDDPATATSETYYHNNSWFITPWECRHSFCVAGHQLANEGMQSQSNKLMEHILKNPVGESFNNDFRSILTSEHYVFNPYVAYIYGLDVNSKVDLNGRITDDGSGTPLFDNPLDQNEWRRIHFEDITGPGNRVAELGRIPSVAGVLTMPTFLKRYFTTSTNLNRTRSKEVNEKFLAVDIMSLVDFTVDPNQALPENQTMNGFSCRVCHAVMDPVGAHFLNYTQKLNSPNATYRHPSNSRPGRILFNKDHGNEGECATTSFQSPDELCTQSDRKDEEECVRGPCFKGSMLGRDYGFGSSDTWLDENDETPRALPALAQKITEDKRFSLAIVRWLHETLLGLKPMKPPKDRYHEDYDDMVEAYVAQYNEIERVRQIFEDTGYDLRAAISAMITGPIFKVKKAKTNRANVFKYAGVGAGQRLIPEQLNRKLKDVLGYPWEGTTNKSSDGTVELLDHHRAYYLMYGGVDNENVLERDRDPNPISAAIARRMAVQMSCLVVPQEFSHENLNDRQLFQLVDIDTTDETLLREQIQWLFLALHGKFYGTDNIEIDAALDLLLNNKNVLDAAAPEDCEAHLEMHTEARTVFDTDISAMANESTMDFVNHAGCLENLYGDGWIRQLNQGLLVIVANDYNTCSAENNLDVALDEGETITSYGHYYISFFEEDFNAYGCTTPTVFLDAMGPQVLLNYAIDLCYLENNGIALPNDYAPSDASHSFNALLIYRWLMGIGIIQESEPYTYGAFQSCSAIDSLLQDTVFPSQCNASKDYYTNENLDSLTERRVINSDADTDSMVRAWQLLLTAMLSDYAFLYE